MCLIMQPSPLSSCYSPGGLKTFLTTLFSNEKCDSYVYVLDTTRYRNGPCSSRQEEVLYFGIGLFVVRASNLHEATAAYANTQFII